MPTFELEGIAGKRLFCSWSGGKDAYLSLQRAVAAGGRPEVLLSMAHEDGLRSRGHGLPLPLLQRQAEALGLRLVTRATTWDDYEETYIAALRELRESGLEGGVFGDIDLQPHRDWVEHVCAVAGMSCHLPLWLQPRRPLIEELLACDVQSTIVAVDAGRLDRRFVGRKLTLDLVAELEALGIDACGEEGEYHTFVTAAPLFSATAPLRWQGSESRDGHWVLRYT
jgi:diphthine-ammonia ligase